VAQARITKQSEVLKIFADASPYRRGPTLALTNRQDKEVKKKGRYLYRP